jgi:RHS repeat-associated protein
MVAITDSSGAIVNKYAYEAHGKVMSQVEAISNPSKYVGRSGVMDDGNGLLYMRARYYDTEVGRFINKDPIGFLGGDLNLYAYVGNNPVNWIDPFGLSALTDPKTKDDLIFYYGYWKTHECERPDKAHCDRMFAGCTLACIERFGSAQPGLGMCVTGCIIEYSYCLLSTQ